MRYTYSLRGRLSLISLLLFAVIAVFGASAFWSLDRFNLVTQDIRDQWLPNTRLLGDLNNYTSDYRAAEADCLIASDPPTLARSCGDMTAIRHQVDKARWSYEQIRHGGDEWGLYKGFGADWDRYLALADRVGDLVAAGRLSEATVLYGTDSRLAYAQASDRLGMLTDRNVSRARIANERSVRAYQRAWWLMAATLGAAALLLVVAMLYVRRSISRPLLGLAETMHRLAEHDTSVTIMHRDRADEIGEMARAVTVFRANAIDLAQSQHGLAQQAAMLEEKLAHEQQLTRMQRNFVSTVAHEFRTPLTLIDAHAQRIVRMEAGTVTPALVDRAERIRLAVRKIIGLIDNLLDTSRLLDSDPSLFFHPENTDVGELLGEVCRLHRELSPHAQILLLPEGGPCVATVDPRLLYQAVSNLLSNAIKYSPEGARIRVTWQSRDGGVGISVRDYGLGIAAQDLARIFDPYYRGRNVAGLVGTGVGLYLVQTVVRLHGGAVDVESVEGEGSVFTMTLPDMTLPNAAAREAGSGVPALNPPQGAAAPR